jgi:hypothetical protein
VKVHLIMRVAHSRKRNAHASVRTVSSRMLQRISIDEAIIDRVRIAHSRKRDRISINGADIARMCVAPSCKRHCTFREDDGSCGTAPIITTDLFYNDCVVQQTCCNLVVDDSERRR